MNRLDALRAVAAATREDDIFIGSVGAMRDDWWNVRPGSGGPAHNSFFPAILGAVTPTAFGVAIARGDRRVLALDSDGSMLMNLSILCTLGAQRPPNLTVVVLDNSAYESAGGGPTHTAARADLCALARAAGCPNAHVADEPAALEELVRTLVDDDELGVVVAKVDTGRHPWPADRRWPFDGVEDKYLFRRHLAADRERGAPGAPR